MMIHTAKRSWRLISTPGVSLNNGLLYFQPVGSDVSGVNTFTLVSTSVVSVNSPGWWQKTKILVAFVPNYVRKWPTMPSLPILPRVGPLRPIFRRPNQSNRSWMKIVKRKENREILRQLKIERLERLYKSRMEKYLKRKKVYDDFQGKLKNGVMRVKRIRVKTANLKLNPYTKTTEYFSGASGNVTDITVVNDKLNKRGRTVSNQTGDISNLSEQFAGFTRVSDVSSAQTRALASAESRASGKIHEKLSEQSLHVANMVAERAQTYDMLAGAVRRLAAFLKASKPVNLGKSALELLATKGGHKRLANQTLEGLFGVVPLISDVQGAAQTLARYNAEDIHSAVHVRSKSSSTETIVHKASTVQTMNGGGDEYVVQTVVTVEVRYVLQYQVSNAMLSELQKLGLTNPAEVAWEMMPWSFVVDWALPIGNWIRSLSSEAGLTFEGGVRTVKTQTTQIIARRFTGAELATMPKESISYFRTGSYTSQRVKTVHQRTVLSGAPTLRFPDFKTPVSITHVIEALALLRQLKK